MTWWYLLLILPVLAIAGSAYWGRVKLGPDLEHEIIGDGALLSRDDCSVPSGLTAQEQEVFYRREREAEPRGA